MKWFICTELVIFFGGLGDRYMFVTIVFVLFRLSSSDNDSNVFSINKEKSGSFL